MSVGKLTKRAPSRRRRTKRKKHNKSKRKKKRPYHIIIFFLFLFWMQLSQSSHIQSYSMHQLQTPFPEFPPPSRPPEWMKSQQWHPPCTCTHAQHAHNTFNILAFFVRKQIVYLGLNFRSDTQNLQSSAMQVVSSPFKSSLPSTNHPSKGTFGSLPPWGCTGDSSR